MIRGHFDGASRGNPGEAGAGAVIYDGDRVIWRCAEPLGVRTNNEAEYMALGLLAAELERRGLRGAEICGDSRLVISQVTGAWKIKEPRLKALADPVIARVKAIGARCCWVPREKNAEADRLSNKALDEGRDREDLSSAVPEELSKVLARKKAEEPASVVQVSDKIWIVREGGEEFAVDAAHRCCTCEEGRRTGKCRHVETVLLENPFAGA